MLFIWGTHHYGSIAQVEGTSIVTRFAMFWYLPLFPIESVFFRGYGQATHAGIPLLAPIVRREVHGIRCERMNLLSVAVAYLRAVGGLVSISCGIGLLTNVITSSSRPDDDGTYTAAVAVAFCIGLTIWLPTYLLLTTRPRSRTIRSVCARALNGIAADPAKVEWESAMDIVKMIDAALRNRGYPSADEAAEHLPEDDKVLGMLLVWTRAKIQVSRDRRQRKVLENDTDRLLQAMEVG
jgi:hypothetical protein